MKNQEKCKDTIPLIPEVTHTFSAELLHHAATFASKVDVRYYLNGVHVRKSKKGCILEASNGHMCILVNDEHGQASESSVIIDMNIIKLIPKKGKVSIYSDGRLSFNNLHEKGAFTELFFERALIDAKYPDINRVIPKNLTPGIHTTAWDNSYIVKAISFFPKLQAKYNGMLCFQGPEVSAAVFMDSKKTCMIVVMPQNDTDNKTYIQPDWLGE